MRVDDTPRTYADKSSFPPRVWRKPAPGYAKHGSGGLCTIREPAAVDLRTLLAHLTGDIFFEGVVSRLFEGRESVTFERTPLLNEIATAIRITSDSQQIVEHMIDRLFQDFRNGSTFVHTEVVMAILFALKCSGASFAKEIIDSFATAGAAEFAPLARFARSIKDS